MKTSVYMINYYLLAFFIRVSKVVIVVLILG